MFEMHLKSINILGFLKHYKAHAAITS